MDVSWFVLIVIALVPEQARRIQVPECKIRCILCSWSDDGDDVEPHCRPGLEIEFMRRQTPFHQRHAGSAYGRAAGRPGQRAFDVNQGLRVGRQAVKTGFGPGFDLMGMRVFLQNLGAGQGAPRSTVRPHGEDGTNGHKYGNQRNNGHGCPPLNGSTRKAACRQPVKRYRPASALLRRTK